MKSIVHGIATFLDSRINPIVLKELRQAVQSRFIIAVLILFLLLQLIVIGVALFGMDMNTANNFTMGREVFMVLQGVMLGTCMVIVPLYAGIRLAAERSETNVDLLFITTIRPATIVWGKLLANTIVALLIASACAPFMVLTYLLRGIDLFSILIILGLDILIVTAAVQLAIFVAAISASLVFKILMGIGLFAALCFGFAATMGISGEFVYYGIGSTIYTTDFWIGTGLTLLCFATPIGLFFVFSIAMLTPASANRAIFVRGYVSAAWLISTAISGYLAWYYADDDPILVWSTIWIFLGAISLILSVSERDTPSRRLTRHIPRRMLWRLPAFVFYSGAANGVTWSLGLLGASVGMWFAFAYWLNPTLFHGHNKWHWQMGLITTAGYILAYTLTATQLRYYLLRKWIKPTLNGALSMLLAVAGCLIPMLVMFFVDPKHWDRHEEYILLLNPTGILFDIDNSNLFHTTTWVASIWVSLIVLLSLPWYIKQLRQFTPNPIENSHA